jgi:hypothetical protein
VRDPYAIQINVEYDLLGIKPQSRIQNLGELLLFHMERGICRGKVNIR